MKCRQLLQRYAANRRIAVRRRAEVGPSVLALSGANEPPVCEVRQVSGEHSEKAQLRERRIR